VRRRGAGAALGLVALIAACSSGPGSRPLRIAATESGGDFTFSLEEPVRAITCVVRDFRRSPTDPLSTRTLWVARCTDGPICRTAIRYGDRVLESATRAAPLVASEAGECYECDLTGDHGHGVTRFRIGARGGFEPCVPRVGDL